jgi:hypothetical protein
MTRPDIQAISPFFIVSNVDQTIAFYRDKLGFEARFRKPEEAPFFAIIGREGAQILVKSDKMFGRSRTTSVIPSWNRMRLPPNSQIKAQHSAHRSTVCVVSKYVTLTGTFCSSADQG